VSNQENSVARRLLRRPIVEEMTGLPCSSMYRLISLGQFPRPVQLPGRCVAWRSEEVQRWIDSREPQERGNAA